MASLRNFLFGKKEKMMKQELFSPEQEQFLNMILKGTQPGMSSGIDYLTQMLSGSKESTEDFEAPYMRQFEEQTIPGIAERFAGVDAQSSSAFGQSLGQAGAGLQENLAALREGLRGQALSQLQGISGMGLGQRFENMFRPGTTGVIGGMAQGAAKGATMALMA